MIVILKKNPPQDQLDNLTSWLKSRHLDIHESRGTSQTILGLVGDTSQIDMNLILALDIVEDVKRIQEPYKSANRKFHPQDSVINCGGTLVGGGHFAMIAGPCSIESPEQIIEVAKRVKAAGANLLRGGAFKPRTSPYSFQGKGEEGLEWMKAARAETGLPLVSEMMDLSQLSLFDDVDVIQVGARNMQNFAMLKELGRTQKPVLLKRGLASTIQEWLMSAEYIMAGGNNNVILCERGIRTFETATRNTLDISAVPLLHQLSHLPVVVDPSHATGVSTLVKPLTLAAVAAGADGVMIEVHNDPTHALCDGPQSLTPDTFDDVAQSVAALREALHYGA